jgi:uncharacterized protein (TIGR03067 family)
MRTGLCVALAWALLRVADLRAVVDRPQKSDNKVNELAKLEGTWKLTSMVVGHREITAKEMPKDAKFLIKGNKILYKDNKTSADGIYKIDPQHNPKKIDLTWQTGPLKGRLLQGVYIITDGEIALCLEYDRERGRPTKLESKPSRVMFLLRREKR